MSLRSKGALAVPPKSKFRAWKQIQSCACLSSCCVAYICIVQVQFFIFVYNPFPRLAHNKPINGVAVLARWHVLTHCLNLPSQGSWVVSHPPGWQQRTRAASLPDEGNGNLRWGSCDLANRSLAACAKTSPIFPTVRVRRASKTRCPSRSVLWGPGWSCELPSWGCFTSELRVRERQY